MDEDCGNVPPKPGGWSRLDWTVWAVGGYDVQLDEDVAANSRAVDRGADIRLMRHCRGAPQRAGYEAANEDVGLRLMWEVNSHRRFELRSSIESQRSGLRQRAFPQYPWRS